ncbi:Uncharacterised protein [Vibrio cholerae]|nr:Uncharacterised protein [Vibrio cholerae]
MPTLLKRRNVLAKGVLHTDRFSFALSHHFTFINAVTFFPQRST